MGDRAREIRERLRGITPGPWKALTCDEAGKLLGFLVSNEQLLARRPEPWYIASMPTLETTEGEDRANARLIANAPADLEWCLDQLDAVMRERDEAVKKRNEWFSSVNELVEMQAERDAALKREGRLREAVLWLVDGPQDCTCWPGCRLDGLREALADEGRE